MIVLLIQSALADACCATGGAQPTILASCDTLGVAFGLGGDLETGGWSYRGDWSSVGDDGGGHTLFSVAMMGRFTPWLQGGLRVPLNLTVDSLDGHRDTTVGVGSGLVWLALETPAAWPSATAPQLALELGLGTEEHSKVLQVGFRGAGARGPWTASGTLTARFPVLGKGTLEGDSSLIVDHVLGPTLRGGLGLGLLAAAGSLPSYALSLGPSLVLMPTHSDRLLLSARAGLPLPHLGQSRSSLVTVHLDWFRVLMNKK